MAKKSQLDQKLAEIDADIARLQEIRAYLAKEPPAAEKRERKPKKAKTKPDGEPVKGF